MKKILKHIRNLFVTRTFLDRRIQEEEKFLTEQTKSLLEEQTSSCRKELEKTIKEYEERLVLQSIVNRFLYRYYTKKVNDISENTDHYVTYYYGTFGDKCNLGDYFQTIATEKALSSIHGEECKFVHVQRNQLVDHPGGTCVMQGWYEHDDLGFLPGNDTRAVWIGTHFTEKVCNSLALLFQNSAYRLYDVGCRDKATLDFCRIWGISSYFSRCLTLTLPKRSEKDSAKADTVYIVDCSDEAISLLPEEIRTGAKIINQRGFIREPWKSWNMCRDVAEELLKEYRQHARLVITSALHCAQPCIAMGIPVVFIKPDYNERNRFSSMDGIVPQYSIQDLKNKNVDFNPKAPNIEELKTALMTNLSLSLKQKRSKEEEQQLIIVRQKITDFNVLENL